MSRNVKFQHLGWLFSATVARDGQHHLVDDIYLIGPIDNDGRVYEITTDSVDDLEWEACKIFDEIEGGPGRLGHKAVV